MPSCRDSACWPILAAMSLLAGAAAPAVAAFPQLSLVLPRGVERGGDRELVFQGARLEGPEEVFLLPAVGGPQGLVVTSIEPIDDKSFKVVMHVPAECPPGEQLVQVRTRSGITEFRSFHVGILPVIDEQEPNNTPAEAQSITLETGGGVTVHGIVTGEDQDCFALELEQGARLSVEVEGLRLGSHRFDPLISVLGPEGDVLALVDDHPAALQDGFFSIVAAAAGRHVVQIREAAWGGDGGSRYRLHMGRFPRPSAVHPAGGKAGEKVKVTFLGDARGPVEREIEVPAGPLDETTRILCAEDGTTPTGLAFRISSLGNTLEHEPNDDLASATVADTTTAFNGIIGKPGDVDHFRFTATKGQSFQVECHARRLGSGLDPVVSIHQADGRQLVANDDAGGPDSGFKFDPPADGEYVLRVKDHLGRGQADFTYRVEMLPTTPSLTLSIPRIDRYSQTRQTIFVPRGNRYAVLMNVQRRNFDGELSLEGNELPAGITMHAPRFQPGKTQVPIVFEAAADAPLGGRLVDFQARQVTEPDPEGTRHPDESRGVRGGFINDADFVLGSPNNTAHYTGRAQRLAVAVIEEVPFRVEIVQPTAPLVRKGRLDLLVKVTRQDGFDKPVTVEFPFRPAGVAANPSLTIPPDQTEGVYQLNANDKAELGTWPVYVLAAGDIGGTAWVASPVATLEIAEPFTEPQLARASGEQGRTVPMACKLEQVRPFEGEATARLVGLPPESTAPELPFTKDTVELVFEVATTDKTPLGNHKTVFVEILTPVAGAATRMSGPVSELQVAKPAAAQAAAPPPSVKPLSRLEQLRQQTAAATP